MKSKCKTNITEMDDMGLIGKSEHINDLRNRIRKASISDRNILIEGPSGTGKQTIAKKIHQLSSRKDKSFVEADCGAGPDTLFDDILFGHEKGAFTGATSSKRGRFEEAHEGTLFLDEIGNLPYETQAKLLKVLDNGEFYKLGGTEPIRVKVRIVAATNRNLQLEISEGRFRDDLYYRITGDQIEALPLKNRPEDIVCLVKSIPHDEKIKIDPFIKFLIYHYDFPGNVRELQHFMQWDFTSVMKEYRKRIKVLNESISQIDITKEIERNKRIRRNKMKRAIDFLEEDFGVYKKVVEALKIKCFPKVKSDDVLKKKIAEWCLKAYEIIILAQRAKLPQDEIAKILHVRRGNITAPMFYKEFNFQYPDVKKKIQYKVKYPLDIFRIYTSVNPI